MVTLVVQPISVSLMRLGESHEAQENFNRDPPLFKRAATDCWDLLVVAQLQSCPRDFLMVEMPFMHLVIHAPI